MSGEFPFARIVGNSPVVRSTRIHRFIRAPRAAAYRPLVHPEAIALSTRIVAAAPGAFVIPFSSVSVVSART